MMYVDELAFAKKLAMQAGEVMRRYHSPDIAIETKQDKSPVTIADKTINDIVIAEVAQAYPEHGVLGEEASSFSGQQYVWVCDPIDGTVPYINHVPTSMFSLALVKDGTPVVAVAFNPWVNELYSAVASEGAFCNDSKIRVSTKIMIGAVLGGTGSTTSTRKTAVESPEFIAAVQQKEAFILNAPGTVFKGCLIAAGYMDGRIFTDRGAHDIAAIKLIIEEAGGVVTDMDGNEQRYDQPLNGAVMSNGIIHQDLLQLIRETGVQRA